MPSQVTYDGPTSLVANQLFHCLIRVRAGADIQAGGRLVVAARHFSDVGSPQMDRPGEENYVLVETASAGAAWALDDPRPGGRHPWNLGLALILKEGTVPAGAEVAVYLGGRPGQGPGYRCQSFAERRMRFRVGIDPLGKGEWEVLPAESLPAIELIGNRAVRLVVTARPDAIDPAGLEVFIKPEDAYGNVSPQPPEAVGLLLDDRSPLAEVRLSPGQAARYRVAWPADGRWHRVTAATSDGAFYARSNPVGPSLADGYRLFWGEIHGQSGLCDGTNSPAEIYEYARQAAGLDFASVSSHDFELTPRDWAEITLATRQAHRPGEFVTFLGYEWSGWHERGGDNNVYFLDDDGPLVQSARRQGIPAWDPAEGTVQGSRDLRQTIDELRRNGRPFMVVPHGGGRQCNLDFHDPSCMPMLEVHSCHRSYEFLADEALRRGLRMGFIGGSDDHRGCLGDSHVAARDRYFSAHNGLVAVYARQLTRESLWEAFFARRVYATNGPRIALDFRVNDVLMGGQVACRAGEALRIAVQAHLDGLLDRIDLFRGSGIIHQFRGGNQQNRVFCLAGQYKEEAAPGATPYFVRVVQTDGGTAWSSPVWVDAARE